MNSRPSVFDDLSIGQIVTVQLYFRFEILNMKTGMAFLTLLLNIGLIFIDATAYTIQKEHQNSPIHNQDSSYILQKYVIPQHYDINIMPNITKDNKTVFNFFGNVTIDIRILSHSNYICLHAQKPYINVYSFMLIKRRIEMKSFTSEYHDDSNIFTIIFGTTLLPGNYSLVMQFNGTSSDDGNGFFKTFYKNRMGKTVYLARTHFQPIGARRVFPCWDEPGIRANFTITIWHHDSYTALSNMLQTDAVPENYEIAKHYDMTRFETTPPIPAYLAAVAITKFEEPIIDFKSDNVWFRQNLSHHINFTRTVITLVAKHLQTKWKNEEGPELLRIVSIPGLQDNGIANWGIIFYREADIVYDKILDPAIQKIKVASLVAREMAHHWFGNFISPFWWHDIWVNDGVAMLLGMEAIDKIYPNFRIMDLFVVQTLHESLHLDGYIEMPPFSSKSNIKTPTEINSLFSLPRYFKASAILRMLKYVLTDDVFWYGAELHLESYKFDMATSDAFLSIMEVALGAKFPYYHLNIQQTMNLWTGKSYYPVLNAKRDYQNDIVLISVENLSTQEDKKWQIPVTITTQTKCNFTLPFRDHGQWLKTTLWYSPTCEFSLPYKEDGWVIINLQQTGYYRVNYDETNWKRITQFLGTEKYTDIHVLNRAQIIDDAFHLMLEHKLYPSIFWNLTDYLRQDADYIAWYPMFKALEFMSSIFPLPEKEVQRIKERITLLLTDLLENIGYNENPNENDLTKSLRQEAARWACAFSASACIDVATNKLKQHNTDPETHKPLPWWKYWTYCNGATNDKIWSTLMRKYEKTSDHNILEAMACYGNFHTIKTYLELTTNKIDIIKRTTDRVYGFFYIVAKHARNHEIFHHLLYQFENIKPKEVSIGAALVHFINHVYTNEQLHEIYEVMKERTNKSACRNIETKIKKRLEEIRSQRIYLTNF